MLKRGLALAQRKLAAFAAVSARIGAGVAGAGAAVLAPLGILASDRLKDIGRLGDLAAAFALTAEEASGLFGVFGALGSKTREATESMVTLQKRVADAISGTGEEAKEFFQKLGVDASKFAGLNVHEQFFLLHESLQAVADPATKVRLLMLAIGEDGGKDLLPVLSRTTDELREMTKQFEISAGDMKDAREAGFAMTMAWGGVNKVLNQVAIALAPTIKTLAELFTPVLKSVGEFIKRNQALVVGLAAGAAVAVAAGVALLALAGVAAGLSAAIGVITTVAGLAFSAFSLLLTPVGLVAAAFVAAGVALVKFGGVGRETFGALKTTFETTWGGIVDAVKAGDLDLAWRIAVAGLKAAWVGLMDDLRNAWREFRNFFEDGWSGMVMFAQQAAVKIMAATQRTLGQKNTGLLAQAIKFGAGPILGPLGGLLEVANKAGDINEDASITAITNRARDEQLARDAQRKADKAKTDAERQAALDELADLRNQAGAAAAGAAGRGGAGLGKKAEDNIKIAAAGARGAFSAIGPRGFFGSGSAAPMVTEQKKTNKILEQIRDKKDGGLKFV
jgi:hypothetical protein